MWHPNNIPPEFYTTLLGKQNATTKVKFEVIFIIFWCFDFLIEFLLFMPALQSNSFEIHYSEADASSSQLWPSAQCFLFDFKLLEVNFMLWRNGKKWQNNPPDNSDDLLSCLETILHVFKFQFCQKSPATRSQIKHTVLCMCGELSKICRPCLKSWDCK